MVDEGLSFIRILMIFIFALFFVVSVIYVLEYHWKIGHSSILHPVRNRIAEEAEIAARNNYAKSQEQNIQYQNQAGQYV